MSRTLPALLLGAVVACHSPPPMAPQITRTFRADTAFSRSQSAALTAAATTWSSYSRGYLQVQVNGDGDWDGRFVYADSSNDVIAQVDEELNFREYTLGRVVYPNTAYMAMDRLDSDAYFFEVALHEMGHMLGLRHVNDRNSIMYPRHTGKRCPSKEDMIELCKAVGCDISDVAWCSG